MRLRYIARADGQRICLVETDPVDALDDLDPDPPPPWRRERKLAPPEAYSERDLPARGRRRKPPQR